MAGSSHEPWKWERRVFERYAVRERQLSPDRQTRIGNWAKTRPLAGGVALGLGFGVIEFVFFLFMGGFRNLLFLLVLWSVAAALTSGIMWRYYRYAKWRYPDS